MCITTYQPDTKSNPNRNPDANPTTKQHAIVNIQLNIVACSTYPDNFQVWGPRGLSSTSSTARGQTVVALALALKLSGLGLGLEHSVIENIPDNFIRDMVMHRLSDFRL